MYIHRIGVVFLDIEEVEFYTDENGELQVRMRIDEPETFTACRCKKCGYIEDVPDFILDEFAGFDRFCGKKIVIPKLECPECNKTMIPLKYFKD